MGKLRACFAVATIALTACGEDSKTPDAGIKLIDAAIDAKVFMDAPPPMYDFTCLNAPAPTTAPATVMISGTTPTITMTGAQPVPNVEVSVFKSSGGAALASETSDANGAFTMASVPTQGMPINGYLRAVPPAPAQGEDPIRTSYLYPGSVVSASLTNVPVLLIGAPIFAFLEQLTGVAQDDAVNGALTIAVTDCSAQPKPVGGATVKIQKNGTDVPDVAIAELTQFSPGTFAALNVPDGDPVQVVVSFEDKTFPTRTVRAFKQASANAPGSVTAVQVRPSN